jgi:hypothetical protein
MVKPTHPVELLACAIALQEGWFAPLGPNGPVLPQLNNNPGDIKYADQLNAVEAPGGFCRFGTPAEGVVGLFRQLWLQVAEGQTVRQVIEQWAPPSENNSAQYLADVLMWTGLPADKVVMSILPPLVQLNLPEVPKT